MNAVAPVVPQLSWEVVQSPIYANNMPIAGYQALTRSDNSSTLHVCKNSYTPTPNSRLIEVTERLSELTGFKQTGYSEAKGGKLILSYLENTEATQILDWKTEDYMVIGNSHDGTTGFFIGTSQQMIRCMNQFSSISKNMKAYHTKNNEVKIQQLLSYFENYKAESDAVHKKLEQFAKVKIDSKIITALAERLFAIESGEQEKLSTRKTNLLSEFMVSVERETADLGNNLHGLFQGVTHYTTHTMKSKEKTFGNLTGQPAALNEMAFNFCDKVLLSV